jgi:hypothetical protein
VVPPSLRQEAAHPMLAWPVQATALGAAASEFVLFFGAYPATAGSSFVVVTAVGLVAFAAWVRLRRRHELLGADVTFPSLRARLARSTSVVVGVAAFAVAGPLAVLAMVAPAADPHADAGHGNVDLGGGPMPMHGAVPSVGVDQIRGRSDTAPVRWYTRAAGPPGPPCPNGPPWTLAMPAPSCDGADLSAA